nr:MAG TPA: hypothetical protein [Caudoviricetes sp.]
MSFGDRNPKGSKYFFFLLTGLIYDFRCIIIPSLK